MVFLNDIKTDKLKLEEAKNLQEDLKKLIRNIRKGNKSEKQQKTKKQQQTNKKNVSKY